MTANSADLIRLQKAPYNLEAEQALLGGLMRRNDALDQVIDFLEAHHFWDPLHGQIYETIAKLILAGKKATPITLKPFFEHAEQIDDRLTAVGYLIKLGLGATSAASATIRDYGRVVYDLAVRRSLVLIGEDIVATACNSPVDHPPKDQIEEAEARLFALVERGERQETISLADAMQLALADGIERLHGRHTGLPTGFPDLDKLLAGGLEPTDLVILGGRPSMGKTALATGIGMHLPSPMPPTPIGATSS